MTTSTVYRLQWQSELDQLLSGLADHDHMAEVRARTFLALIARDASQETVTDVFLALRDQWEQRK